MRTVAFDGRMGASGDMLLGTLLAAGADPDVLDPIVAALGVEFEIDRTVTHGISSTRVTLAHGESRDDDAEGHGPHRTYGEVVDVVQSLALPADVESNALAAFRLLGEAESAVHGTHLEHTHFHEVGADDAIADVTGVALLLADLDVDRIVTGPLSTGNGEVSTSHGIYPIPPPAVVEIAERSSITLRGGPVDRELLTPTGAAILGAMAAGVEALPPMSVGGVGYGIGSHEFPDRPNVLRAIVGETTAALHREDIRVLETHLDDATPEILGHLQDRLREVGALDVVCLPLGMKKSRPGHLVKVVVQPADEERVARTIAEETGTLGVRSSPSAHRWIAGREMRTVTIRIDGQDFEVPVKVGTDRDGTILDLSAEFDDAAQVASEVGRPVREVIRWAESAADDEL